MITQEGTGEGSITIYTGGAKYTASPHPFLYNLKIYAFHLVVETNFETTTQHIHHSIIILSQRSQKYEDVQTNLPNGAPIGFQTAIFKLDVILRKRRKRAISSKTTCRVLIQQNYIPITFP